MAQGQRKTKSKPRSTQTRGHEQLAFSKKLKDSNKSRRRKYGNSPEFRSKVLKSNREQYRKDNPKTPSKLVDGLLTEAVSREVIVEGMEHPVVADVYNMPETAAALGRSPIGIKRWIKDGILPPPVIRDAVRNYPQYSRGELKLIAKALAQHEQEYEYLSHTHTLTINRLWQSLEAFRKSNI